MTELQHGDFDAFMREVTGFDPFPWQSRLYEQVRTTGWPALLDLPTGTGKTSALLIALFALALDPDRSARRIALIVDRRIIVDQVDAFARNLADALRDPRRPVCARVAKRLLSLATGGDGMPVRVVQLRGGIPRDDSWVGTPDQPTIIASTVDQIGSRLLFRGYGVSEGMRPIHAGILARDSLFFLDEVHLAAAFEQTLTRLHDNYADWAERGGTGRPLTVVRMSATPRDGEPVSVFGLDDADREHPLLARRLGASRPATLEVVKTKRATTAVGDGDNRALIAEVASGKALQAVKQGARRIGVVVNRVDTARRTAARLRANGSGEVLLVTGRMRPYDRTSIQARLGATVAAGLKRSPDSPPTFVVATSCIEAGADLDFDALVTEAASLDALRQRFGRLNRLGDYEGTTAWVLARNDQLGAKPSEDPVYGFALAATWTYLNEIARDKIVDFGLTRFPQLEELDPERRKELFPPAPEAPLLFPSYLDMWAETRPAPHPDPDPALWLHGKDARRERDVHVVFRADVPAPGELDGEQVGAVKEAVEFLPPVADEAVSVPIQDLESWLGPNALVWRWTAAGLGVTTVEAVEVGDTLLVSASHGGLGAGTWDPAHRDAVEDVGERATFAVKRVAKLRIDPRTLPPALRVGAPTLVGSDDPDELAVAKRACSDWLDELNGREDVPADWQLLIRELSESKKRVLTPARSDNGWVWRVTAIPKRGTVEATTEDTISVYAGVEVPLAIHLEDVEAWSRSFARSAGLEASIASDVELAGLLHDLGKADIRFQALLRGGDPIAVIGTEPLAKSRQFGSIKARDRAERRSGWPIGLRHELVSLALLDASPALQGRANDLELVRHLVASHHGWCRPWAPTTIDPEPVVVRVTVDGVEVEVSTAALTDEFLNECASRFRRLCRRYGWHGLAYLEALLRLGDHRASAKPGDRPGAQS